MTAGPVPAGADLLPTLLRSGRFSAGSVTHSFVPPVFLLVMMPRCPFDAQRTRLSRGAKSGASYFSFIIPRPATPSHTFPQLARIRLRSTSLSPVCPRFLYPFKSLSS